MATNKPEHVLSIYLKQNDSRGSNFSKFWWQLFDIWATLDQLLGTVKQLFLNLLAQSIHAYTGAMLGVFRFKNKSISLLWELNPVFM